MQTLIQQHPYLGPALVAVVIYGVRYLVLALGAYLVARPTAGRGWGRTHENAPSRFDLKRNVSRELLYSFYSVLMFGAINAVLFGTGLVKSSQLYLVREQYPTWWFWLSIVVMLLLHDAFFYWLHRLMHTRLLFRVMHWVHHQSIHPTAFAAYSFHPTEALAQGLIVTAILFLVPVHPLAFLIFQTISTAYNVYGHCGREFYPRGMASHPLGKWINTSTEHALHHARGHRNYGLYFLFWDRLMKTHEAAGTRSRAKRPSGFDRDMLHME